MDYLGQFKKKRIRHIRYGVKIQAHRAYTLNVLVKHGLFIQYVSEMTIGH